MLGLLDFSVLGQVMHLTNLTQKRTCCDMEKNSISAVNFYNRATFLRPGEGLEYESPSYRLKTSFRNSLLEIIRRRNARHIFRVSSQNLKTYISRNSDESIPLFVDARRVVISGARKVDSIEEWVNQAVKSGNLSLQPSASEEDRCLKILFKYQQLSLGEITNEELNEFLHENKVEEEELNALAKARQECRLGVAPLDALKAHKRRKEESR